MKSKIFPLSAVLAAFLLALALPLLWGSGENDAPAAPSPSQGLTLITASPMTEATPSAAPSSPTPLPEPTVSPTPEPAASPSSQPTASPSLSPTPEPSPETNLPVEGRSYYDLENVVLYLDLYGTLPDNYITKNQARDLGWSGGSVENYLDGAAIGGDRFGNREGQLPTANGRRYTECDLNTNGRNSRGAERLCFSNDGLYFYTGDHYEHFTEYVITEDWEVVPK